MSTEETASQRLMLVEPVVRRVLAARVRANVVDDLVQDTVLRLVPIAHRLPLEELTPYAIVSAQNAARSRLRRDARARRLQSEALDHDWSEGPEVGLVAEEEAAAVARAMATLAVEDQDLLRAHHLDGETIESIAKRLGRTEMAVRVHLARARAKLRVAYAVEDAGTPLSTERCRRVLEALAMGDRRGQARIGAGDHLKGCPVCSALVAPVTGTRRPAVGIFAAALIWWRTASTGTHAAAVGGVAAAVVVAGVAVASPGSPPAPDQAAPRATTTVPTTQAQPSVTVPGRIQTPGGSLPSSPAGLAGRDGTVTGRSVTVRSVPSDEGFWISADDGGQLWVELVGDQGESAIRVEPGVVVSFDGEVVANAAGFIDGLGLGPGENAAELSAQGYHLQVPFGAVSID